MQASTRSSTNVSSALKFLNIMVLLLAISSLPVSAQPAVIFSAYGEIKETSWVNNTLLQIRSQSNLAETFEWDSGGMHFIQQPSTGPITGFLQSRIEVQQEDAQSGSFELSQHSSLIYNHLGGWPIFIANSRNFATFTAFVRGPPGTPYRITVDAVPSHPAGSNYGSQESIGWNSPNPGWLFYEHLNSFHYTHAGNSTSNTISYNGAVYSSVQPSPTFAGSVGYGNTGPGQLPFVYWGELNYDVFVTVSNLSIPVPSAARQPGDVRGPKEQLQCGSLGSADESLMTGTLNLATGNLLFSIDDPVKTRSYPLRNRIHINTQVVEADRPMGNGTFNYDIHVFAPSMPGNSEWMVVDGDGQRLSYGNGGAPVARLGNFATLMSTATGFKLINAGSPERLREGGNFEYEFDTNGSLISLKDPAGNIQSLSYANGRLGSITDLASNKALTFTWVGNRIASVDENGGTSVCLVYNSLGRLTSVTLSDALHGNSKSFNFAYNGLGVLKSFSRDDDPASAYSITYTWTASGQVPMASAVSQTHAVQPSYLLPSPVVGGYVRTNVSNAKGGTVSYDFDQNLDTISITYPSSPGANSKVVSMGYDIDRNLTSWSDGVTSRGYEYYSLGRLKKISRPDGTLKNFTWSGFDLTSITDSLGILLTISYGNSTHPHLPTSVLDGAGNAWKFTRNSYGQIEKVLPPAGSPSGILSYVYDEDITSSSYGWMLKEVDGLGHETRFDTFSPSGDVTSVSTDNDVSTALTRNIERMEFDSARRPTTVTHPDGRTVKFRYQYRDLDYIEDESGARTNFTFCANCGALEEIASPLGHFLNWGLDSDRDVVTFRDARQKTTQFTHGQARELLQVSYPDASVEQYRYDKSLRVRKVSNARLQDTEYHYDSLGRQSKISFPTTGDTPQIFAYHGDDSIASFSDETGKTRYEYYPNRLLKAEIVDYSLSGLGSIQRVEYEYWPDSLLKKITWKSGVQIVASWDYSYDQAGRVSNISYFNNVDSYTYDDEDKILSQNNANGTSVNYRWNHSRAWPITISHHAATGAIASYTAEYDDSNNTVGNLTHVKELSGDEVYYTYDQLHRLTSEKRIGGSPYGMSYKYDLASNLTHINGVGFGKYDAANNLVRLTGGTARHDADGNVTSIVSGGIPQTTLAWTPQSRLKSQASPSGLVLYKYDALGRRVLEQTANVRHFYVFAGDKLLGEILNNIPSVAYTWGPDGLVSETLRPTTTAQTLWYHYGLQGETRYLSDQAGTIVDAYLYDAYGNPVFASGVNYNPHRYGGKYGYYSNLNSAGLVLAGARWYAPALRRWTSRDPIRYAGGENLLAYVGGNPVRWVDPSGLWPEGGGPDSDTGPGVTSPDFPFNLFDPPDLIAAILTGGISLGESIAKSVVPRLVLVETGAIRKGTLGATCNISRKGLSSNVRFAAGRLGVSKEQAQRAVENAKRSVGRGGADNVLINPRTGDIIDPFTGEILGTIFE